MISFRTSTTKIRLLMLSSMVLIISAGSVCKVEAQVVTRPSISAVSGTYGHGDTITISGVRFGVKSPAAPLWWDNGEGAAVNDPNIMMSGDITGVITTMAPGQKHYNDAWPMTGVTNVNARMQYHPIPWHNVAGPHSRSTKFLAGCHVRQTNPDDAHCNGSEPARNVLLNISDGSTHDVWYVSYYLRLDPLWPARGADGNYKEFNWENEPPYTAYQGVGMANYDAVNSCGGGYNDSRRSPDCFANWMQLGVFSIMDLNLCGDPANGHYPVATGSRLLHNPWRQWVKNERLMKYSTNDYKILRDNIFELDTKRDVEGGCTLGTGTAYNYGPYGGATVGGYYVTRRCGGALMRDIIDDNACRYFDDVYVDNTFSRVVLTNNSVYDSATIIEPQIPSSWSDTSITVMVNRGKLPDSGNLYLFIFDANNNHNTTGYPIAITAVSDTMPPAKPTPR